MPGARTHNLAVHAVHNEIGHGDELPRRDLAHDDVVRRSEEVARLRMLARERTEDELRQRHVGRRFDTVPGDVAEHDREPPVVECQEVVHVAADVDPRRRLVDLPHLEAGAVGPRARQERALHRVGELLLLLIEAGVVDCKRRLPRNRDGSVNRLGRDRSAGTEREDAERGNHLSPCRETGRGIRARARRGMARHRETDVVSSTCRTAAHGRGSRALRPRALRP